MDDHLRIMERNIALAERAAHADAHAWQDARTRRRGLRPRLATILIALATRLDPHRIPTHRENAGLAQATRA